MCVGGFAFMLRSVCTTDPTFGRQAHEKESFFSADYFVYSLVSCFFSLEFASNSRSLHNRLVLLHQFAVYYLVFFGLRINSFICRNSSSKIGSDLVLKKEKSLFIYLDGLFLWKESSE